MKRLSEKAQWWLERISRKIKRRSNKKLIKLRRRKNYLNKPKNNLSSNKKTHGNPLTRIIAPETFSIESNRARGPLLQFLADLRNTFLRDDIQTLTIDFTRTVRFVAGATLLFYAELSRLIEISKNPIRIRYKPPLNDRASQVLDQIGVSTMCGKIVKKRSFYYDDVVHWRVAHGSIVDNSICAPAIETFEGQLAFPLVNGLFRGLSEAMTNAKHHAYLDVRADGLNYRPPHEDWWMFSQERQGYLSVVFCDLGIGIPNTLPLKKPSLFEQIKALGRANSDGTCIEKAIEDSLTRTKLPERGKGLGNIVDVVSGLKNGLVMVFSNRGCYVSENGAEPKIYDFKESILGTLICWRVPLAGESNRGN